jgi:hypothetical protein
MDADGGKYVVWLVAVKLDGGREEVHSIYSSDREAGHAVEWLLHMRENLNLFTPAVTGFEVRPVDVTAAVLAAVKGG